MSRSDNLLADFPHIAQFDAVTATHLTHQLESCQRLHPDENYVLHAVGGGVAAFTKSLYTRKLNHVVQFGMNGPVTADDIATLVETATDRGSMVPEIDLCPLADPTAQQVLESSGWVVNGLLGLYAKPLDDNGRHCAPAVNPDIRIVQAKGSDEEDFVQASVNGFRDGGRPIQLLELLARSAFERSDTEIYFAIGNDSLVGSAGLAVFETDIGRIAHLYIDSTLPEFRGKGIQSALAHARLVRARELGCVWATVDARPGTGSSRNAERLGLQHAYTRSTFARQ